MYLANLRLKWSIKSIHALYQHIFNVFKLHFLPWTYRNAEELDEYKTAATIKSPTATVFEKQKLKKHSWVVSFWNGYDWKYISKCYFSYLKQYTA